MVKSSDLTVIIIIPGTTKNNHNILQGVANPGIRLTEQERQTFDHWIEKNAYRYWFSEGGPLAAGGIDVAFVGTILSFRHVHC